MMLQLSLLPSAPSTKSNVGASAQSHAKQVDRKAARFPISLHGPRCILRVGSGLHDGLRYGFRPYARQQCTAGWDHRQHSVQWLRIHQSQHSGGWQCCGPVQPQEQRS
ncbi:hypothetical protein WJX77_001233 [Trebouxia sp. C0004]